jgi:hypothetical protein
VRAVVIRRRRGEGTPRADRAAYAVPTQAQWGVRKWPGSDPNVTPGEWEDVRSTMPRDLATLIP